MEWRPNNYLDFVLMDNDVKDEEVIKQFVHYHNLPLIVNDICNYAKKELNSYPEKITNKGIVFWSKGYKIEIEISDKIYIYKFYLKVESNPINIKYVLKNGDIFSFLSLKTFFN